MLPEKERNLSPAQRKALMRLSSHPEWKVLLDLASLVLDEIRHDYIDEGIQSNAEQEGIASARVKGNVQGIIRLFNRIKHETNRDVRDNSRE